jgi:hypothetical protein
MGKATKPRKSVPTDVKQTVLHEAGYKCGRPACRNVITLDLHHLVPVADMGGDTSDNLLPLCGYCHDMHRAGHFPEGSLRAWKMLLVAMNEAFDRASVDTLLTLDKLTQVKGVSADGVLRLGSLIASGLVNASFRFVGPGGAITEDFTLELTPKGKLFLEAWKKGDQDAALAALAPTS